MERWRLPPTSRVQILRRHVSKAPPAGTSLQMYVRQPCLKQHLKGKAGRLAHEDDDICVCVSLFISRANWIQCEDDKITNNDLFLLM